VGWCQRIRPASMSRYSLCSDVRGGTEPSRGSGLLAGTGCRVLPEFAGAFCVARVVPGLAAGRGLTPGLAMTRAVLGRVVAALGRVVAALGRAVAPLAAALGRVVAALGLLVPVALDPVPAFLPVPAAVLVVMPARPVVPPALAAVAVDLDVFAE